MKDWINTLYPYISALQAEMTLSSATFQKKTSEASSTGSKTLSQTRVYVQNSSVSPYRPSDHSDSRIIAIQRQIDTFWNKLTDNARTSPPDEFRDRADQLAFAAIVSPSDGATHPYYQRKVASSLLGKRPRRTLYSSPQKQPTTTADQQTRQHKLNPETLPRRVIVHPTGDRTEAHGSWVPHGKNITSSQSHNVKNRLWMPAGSGRSFNSKTKKTKREEDKNNDTRTESPRTVTAFLT